MSDSGAAAIPRRKIMQMASPRVRASRDAVVLRMPLTRSLSRQNILADGEDAPKMPRNDLVGKMFGCRGVRARVDNAAQMVSIPGERAMTNSAGRGWNERQRRAAAQTCPCYAPPPASGQR